MAKIGPSLPPQIPRSQPQEPTEPGAPPRPPVGADGKPLPAALKHRGPQVPQGKAPQGKAPQGKAPQGTGQPGAGGSSAARLAREPLVPQRPQRRQEGPEDSAAHDKGTEEQTHGADTKPGLLGAAFMALRRARKKRSEKTRGKKKAGPLHEVDAYHSLEDEEEEDVVNRSSVRTWLGSETSEDSTFDEARREARLLEHMEKQGEPPSRILGEFTRQLGRDHSVQFKYLLAREVRPQLDSLAERVAQVSTDERRKLAAYVSRALHQAGAENAPTFDKLLASTVAAEAEHLAQSTGSPAVRAEEFSQALRRASSPVYRGALVTQSRASLEWLARESAGVEIPEFNEVLAHLLRAGEALLGPASTALADAFVTGLVSAGRPEAVTDLAELLCPALRATPGGGFWVLQLILVLTVHGQHDAAQHLAGQFQQLLHESRERCRPLFLALREPQGPQKNGAREQALRQQLDEAALLLARLLPACGAMFSLQAHLPPALVTEALVVLGSLEQVGGTTPGQHAIRQALLDQDRGDWTFLNALPTVAPVLSQPQCLRMLEEGGLVSLPFKLGAHLYLKRVATDLARSLGTCLVAWSQKGDASAARMLLRSALYLNAPLYGLGADALEPAFAALEDLRAKPSPKRGQRCMTRLEALARRYPTPNRSGSIHALRPLVHELSERDPLAMSLDIRTRVNTEGAARLTSLEIRAGQSILAKEQSVKRQEEEAAEKAALEARTKRPGLVKTPGTPSPRR